MALTLATGDDNTAVGYSAGDSITTGQRNVMVGSGAGHALVDDNDNVCVGYQAGDNLTAGDGNVIIGSYVDALDSTGSKQLAIGGADGASDKVTWITGDSTGGIYSQA